jgi:PHS family inorganic phosphate transporter-like MFS transporter
MVAAVFSMQGLGQLIAAVVALVTATGFKDSYINIPNEAACDATCRLAADRSWRIIVGVGAIPACLALYYRITIPETPRYTFDVQFDVEKADSDIRAYISSQSKGDIKAKPRTPATIHLAGPPLNISQASWSDFFAYFSEWKHLKVLIGTTMSWFFLVSKVPAPTISYCHAKCFVTGLGVLRPRPEQYHCTSCHRLC